MVKSIVVTHSIVHLAESGGQHASAGLVCGTTSLINDYYSFIMDIES